MRELRLRLVATKEDNPWLPEDLQVKSGLMCPPPRSATETLTLEMVRGMARALLHRLREDGLL